MDVGIRINRLLYENQMDQKDLAEALNCTQATMSRWVKGTRTPASKGLCAIADYFDVSVDWLLGRSEHRNYNGFISGDDALEYCEKAREAAWKCWYKVAKFDVTEISAASLANNTQACAYFEREILRWEYDIPRMIHSLADGTWKEADRKTEPQTESNRPQGEWIPCGERLPKDRRPVLVTWKNTDPEIYYQYITGEHFTGTAHYHRGKWYWYSSVTEDLLAEYGKCDPEEFDEAIKVVAWMPLPEPWKGAEDENQGN